jgi:hypothetical protein
MINRLTLIYAVLGPIGGALLYVSFSMLAGQFGYGGALFMDPRSFGHGLSQNILATGWQIALSSPLSALPAVLTAMATNRAISSGGSCPWWKSCSYGAFFSGLLALPFLTLAGWQFGHEVVIPHPAPGSALIALIGFLGTWPCWLLAAQGPLPYRSSPQNR